VGDARGFGKDPMLNGRRMVALEPRRVVVELSREQFDALDRASGRVGAAVFLRLVALRVIAELETTPRPHEPAV
jgi:hypothetical protein